MIDFNTALAQLRTEMGARPGFGRANRKPPWWPERVRWSYDYSLKKMSQKDVILVHAAFCQHEGTEPPQIIKSRATAAKQTPAEKRTHAATAAGGSSCSGSSSAPRQRSRQFQRRDGRRVTLVPVLVLVLVLRVLVLRVLVLRVLVLRVLVLVLALRRRGLAPWALRLPGLLWALLLRAERIAPFLACAPRKSSMRMCRYRRRRSRSCSRYSRSRSRRRCRRRRYSRSRSRCSGKCSSSSSGNSSSSSSSTKRKLPKGGGRAM